MTRPLNMNAMMYFEAVARHSRVNLAAEELLVSPSAVSQQIKLLEEQLGVLLFRRIKRRLILTEDGERLYQSATQAIRMLRDAKERIGRTRERRSLVVRVSASFGVRWLGPKLADFINNNPGIDLHIDATSELTDFEKEAVDIEIRYAMEPISGMVCEPIIVDRVLPLAAPRLATNNDTDPKRLFATNRLIHTVKAAIQWKDWLNFQKLKIDHEGGLKFDRSSMALRAAADGLGIVLETATLATNELRNGTLVPITPELGCLNFPAYWIVCPKRHLNRRAVQMFNEWIAEQAKQHENKKTRLLKSLGVVSEHSYEIPNNQKKTKGS